MRISDLSSDVCSSDLGRGLVYLAGPFFDIGQRWVIEEAKADLEAMGVEVFSPIHEVGPGPAEVIAAADLEGLERSSVVLAIVNGMDPGTIFEIGYATKMGIPVVALAQNVKAEDVKMIAGTGAIVTSAYRSDERRLGKECVSTCRSRWSPDH